MDTIIVGQQAWDITLGSNCKDIALEFSKNRRVLYVNPPLDRITKMRFKGDPKIKHRIDVISGEQCGLHQEKENLWILFPDIMIESINWIRSSSVFSLINKRNNRKFSSSIKRAITKLGFRKFILFNDSDIFRSFYLKELLEPNLTIYYSRDNIVATKYWKRHGVHLEPKLIAKCDLCLTNSTYLKDYCYKYNLNSYCVGQGFDIEAFSSKKEIEEPELFKAVKKPIVGYVGAVTVDRLDIEIITLLAQTLPESSIVLIGPQDEVFKRSHLHSIANIIFVDAQPPSLLPAHINSFTVCINPQLLNELTIGNYPRKIDEYLASGKTVVATRTRAMEDFDGYVFLAGDKYEFRDLVLQALKLDVPSALSLKRKDFAYSHSWAKVVDNISRILKETKYK